MLSSYCGWGTGAAPRNTPLYLPAPAPFLRCPSFYGHIAGVRSRVDHWHSCFGHCGFVLPARWVARIRKKSFNRLKPCEIFLDNKNFCCRKRDGAIVLHLVLQGTACLSFVTSMLVVGVAGTFCEVEPGNFDKQSQRQELLLIS